MYERRGSEYLVEKVDVPHIYLHRRGIPQQIEIINPEGIVFRHYTNRGSLKKITASGELKAGWTPFFYSGYMNDFNSELTGIFLTTASHTSGSVGVRANNRSYIDLILPNEVKLLKLREGIYLIPGTAQIENWKLDIYRDPSARKRFPEYEESFKSWDKEGIPEPLRIPIEILNLNENI